MNTLSSITTQIVNSINEQTIDDLISLGYNRDHAVKVVTEFEYDMFSDSLNNPADGGFNAFSDF